MQQKYKKFWEQGEECLSKFQINHLYYFVVRRCPVVMKYEVIYLLPSKLLEFPLLM